MFLKSLPAAEKKELEAAIKHQPTLRIDYPKKGLKVWVVGDTEIVKIVARRMTDNPDDCIKFIDANGKLPTSKIAGIQKRHHTLIAKGKA